MLGLTGNIVCRFWTLHIASMSAHTTDELLCAQIMCEIKAGGATDTNQPDNQGCASTAVDTEVAEKDVTAIASPDCRPFAELVQASKLNNFYLLAFEDSETHLEKAINCTVAHRQGFKDKLARAVQVHMDAVMVTQEGGDPRPLLTEVKRTVRHSCSSSR